MGTRMRRATRVQVVSMLFPDGARWVLRLRASRVIVLGKKRETLQGRSAFALNQGAISVVPYTASDTRGHCRQLKKATDGRAQVYQCRKSFADGVALQAAENLLFC